MAFPKPPGQRVRQNRGQGRYAEASGAGVPEMPGAGGLDPDVRLVALEYWGAIWSELGGMYLGVNRFPLARLCVLHARVQLGQRVGAQLQSELRQLEVEHGVSPLGRRRLQWEVARATGESDPANAAPSTDELARRRERREVASS